jgi:hypothetical protein
MILEQRHTLISEETRHIVFRPGDAADLLTELLGITGCAHLIQC